MLKRRTDGGCWWDKLRIVWTGLEDRSRETGYLLVVGTMVTCSIPVL